MTNDALAEAPLKLLRVLNERQAHDQEGAIVIPNTEVANAAALEHGSREYENALEWLVNAGALIPDDETDYLLQDVTGNPQSFKFTRTGLELLHKRRSHPNSTETF